jgi:hypothetical protein
VAAGILSNTLLKTGFALVLARPPFRRIALTGLGAMGVAMVGSILLIRSW